MKDEIKEILLKDFNEILVKEFCTDWKEKRLYIELLVNSTPFSNLLDYITNLQDRIDKAIEYIKENSYFEGNAIKTMIYQDYSKYILETLQGKSDE